MTYRELMQRVLQALEDIDCVSYTQVDEVAAALRELLAQKDKQDEIDRDFESWLDQEVLMWNFCD